MHNEKGFLSGILETSFNFLNGDGVVLSQEWEKIRGGWEEARSRFWNNPEIRKAAHLLSTFVRYLVPGILSDNMARILESKFKEPLQWSHIFQANLLIFTACIPHLANTVDGGKIQVLPDSIEACQFENCYDLRSENIPKRILKLLIANGASVHDQVKNTSKLYLLSGQITWKYTFARDYVVFSIFLIKLVD